MDQTQPDETHTEKPAVCLDDGKVELEKKNFVESSSQTEWQLSPKENFLPVPLARRAGLRGTVMQLEASSPVQNNQSSLSVEGSAQESTESLDFQEKVEAPSEVKGLNNNDTVKAKVSGPASPLLKTRNEDGTGSDERLEEEETNSGQKLVTPSHCAPKSSTMVGDNKEESILPDMDNADVVMGILQEDIEQSNNIEEVLQQPTNNDVLADLIAELNNGLCDENKNPKAVENGGDCSPARPLLAVGSGGSDQLVQSGAAQQLVVEKAVVGRSLANQEGEGNSTTGNSTPTPQPPTTRPGVIRVPFPFPSRGVATDRIAISPMACLPLTAFRPVPGGKKTVSFPSTLANNTHQHLVPVKRPLPLMDHKLTPGTHSEPLSAMVNPTLPPMTPNPSFLPGLFDSYGVENSKVPHGGLSDGNRGGLADANLNTITISSDEEVSQVPGSLQEVGFDCRAPFGIPFNQSSAVNISAVGNIGSSHVHVNCQVLVEVFRVVSSHKAASHFRWNGNGLPPPYFRMTSAPIDLSMMEKKVKEAIYSAATQFRADLQAMVTACKDGLDVGHPVKKAAMYLMALAEQSLSMYGLGKGRSTVAKNNGGARGRGGASRGRRGRGRGAAQVGLSLIP